MPKPRRGETEEHYIGRCIPVVLKEGTAKDQKQAAAICYSLWADRHKKKSYRPAGIPAGIPGQVNRFSYSIKYASDMEALDAEPREITFDQSKMCATGVLATVTRDREGDIMEVGGILTLNHQINPIALLDHGLYYPMPIGRCSDAPYDGNYTVFIDPERGECLQTTYFYQKGPGAEVAEQVYHLYCEGMMKANSIGYRTLKSEPMRPGPGKHILECELIEATWCGIPANPDAVMATLSRDRLCGRPVNYAIKSLLTPYLPPRSHWERGADIPVGRKTMSNANVEKKGAMSSIDQTQGGALRADGAPMDAKKKAHPPETEEVPVDKKTVTAGKANPEGTREEPADQPGEQEVKEMPHGQALMQHMHEHLESLLDHCTKEMKTLDNEKVKKFMTKAVEHLEKVLESAYEAHDKIYEPGDGEEEHDEDEEGDEGQSQRERDNVRGDDGREGKSGEGGNGDEPEEVETAEEREREKQGKSLSGLERKVLDLEKEIKSLKTRYTGGSDEESLTPEEQRELAALERSVARKERLVARLGL